MKPKPILCLTLVLSGHCHAAIVYPKAPDGGRQMVYDNAAHILQFDPKSLGGFRIEELTIGNPYPGYFVRDLTKLASGELLSATTSGGSWTYLFIHGTNAVGAEGLIAGGKTGNELRFNGLYETDSPNGTMEALRIAEQLPQVK